MHIAEDSYKKALYEQNSWLLTALSHINNINDREELGIRLMVLIAMINEPNIDNIRAELIKNSNKYFKLRNKGCCGFYDTQLVCTSGNTYLLGFNYGH